MSAAINAVIREKYRGPLLDGMPANTRVIQGDLWVALETDGNLTAASLKPGIERAHNPRELTRWIDDTLQNLKKTHSTTIKLRLNSLGYPNHQHL